ncbi:MAG: 5-oxoprolinase/urea amidolyase family protein, partial [Pseudomonadota bacterium]|nr:5-oxoprolinase/urea amidolyase family protein [Pseudomonadota bacterium]
VIAPGTLTTIQDFPGRQGHWDVGVPPSGPFDDWSFRLGNRLLDNPTDAAGLEITLQGPTLRFHRATQVVIAGAKLPASLDGNPINHWEVIDVPAGATLTLGKATAGARAYLLVRGGIECPQYLGSRSTFTLGQFGGHGGRALRSGDMLELPTLMPAPSRTLDNALAPAIGKGSESVTEIAVLYGPHGAPDFFTDSDIERFFDHEWEVHYNSSRTGVRLIGPRPEWARADGGEAGLHPSNIHDNAYAFGTIDFTGDMPVILGPDGPSLGGFVCPATVVRAERWKLGQLTAGDKVRFVPVTLTTARALEARQLTQLASLAPIPNVALTTERASPILRDVPASEAGERVVYRRAGDDFLLIEFGPMELDIALRFRVHAWMLWLREHPLTGLRELTPGIRSLQVHFEPLELSLDDLLVHLQQAEQALVDVESLEVESRIVHLPLSWDDPACQEAIDKYQRSVRPDAPWCPSNLDFIRRINALESEQQVRDIVFNARYLVMGLGDVYLGAPVATPLDPRHRLVTTKYNPA